MSLNINNKKIYGRKLETYCKAIEAISVSWYIVGSVVVAFISIGLMFRLHGIAHI